MSDTFLRNRLKFIGLAQLVAVLVQGCGGGGGGGSGTSPNSGPPAPTQLNDVGCVYQYTLTNSPLLSGVDPLLAQQWHLNNTGQSGGNAGEDIRAFAAWSLSKGAGSQVAVVDDAVEVVHDDLKPNVAAGASYNYRLASLGNDFPLPCHAGDEHGTAVAGLILAKDGNAIGGTGVAPAASLAVYNALATSTDADIANALTRDPSNTAIYNNSWGSPDNGALNAAAATFKAAITAGITSGRNGRGSIYVISGGNGGCYTPSLNANDECTGDIDNANFDGYTNQLGVIAACAVTDRGKKSWYGEPGANLFICGLSSNRVGNISTTTVNDGYRTDFSGTSATTPMVSGVIALMLSVRPELTWRDVRLILAETARQNDSTDAGWSSHFGYHFNHKYGFGVVDAQAAAARARTWASVEGMDQLKSCNYSNNVDRPIPDATGPPPAVTPVLDQIAVTASDCSLTKIEFVEISFSATHRSSGDLRVRLTSPNGLVSELANARGCVSVDAAGHPTNNSMSCGDYDNWQFGSVRHLGEAPAGNWTLDVTDMINLDSGNWTSWSLKFWGR